MLSGQAVVKNGSVHGGSLKGIPAEYEVLHRCGEGTFGQVFLCATKTGKFAAIKTIKQEASKQVLLHIGNHTLFSVKHTLKPIFIAVGVSV
jgi:hypothetical protein